jgi:arylformamidase
VSFFEAAEIANDCRRLLLRTRNSLPQSSAMFDPNFVAVSSESAQWLVDRGIELIGIDGPSIQPFHDEDNRVHQVLLAAGVIVLEGLDLKDVEPAHYHLTALPLNIPEAEGAPVRAILAQEEAQ